MTAVAIRCTDVHVRYSIRSGRPLLRDLLRGNRPAVTTVDAVRGVTLDIAVGECIGMVGPNGSGKTTLLQAMTGVLPLTSGVLRVRSLPTFLGVKAALRPRMTGRANIRIGLLAQGLRRHEVEARLDDVVEFTDLGPSIDLPMETYSSGMRARLHFAIATALTPEILLVDDRAWPCGCCPSTRPCTSDGGSVSSSARHPTWRRPRSVRTPHRLRAPHRSGRPGRFDPAPATPRGRTNAGSR